MAITLPKAYNWGGESGFREGSLEDYMYRRSVVPDDLKEMLEAERGYAGDISSIVAELSDWEALRETLTRPVDRIANWLVGFEVDRLREQLNRVQAEADTSRYKRKMLEQQYEYGEWGAPWGEKITGGLGVSLAQERAAKRGEAEPKAPEREYPVPEWMRAYLESSMQTGKEGVAYGLRPLGAQTDLSPERMGEMAGYLTWGKAGAPLSYEDYVKAAENMESWWEEYSKLSQSLFPTEVGTQRIRWTPRRQ